MVYIDLLQMTLAPQMRRRRRRSPLSHLSWILLVDVTIICSCVVDAYDTQSRNNNLWIIQRVASWGTRTRYSLSGSRLPRHRQYCMPAEGVPLSPRSALLSREELLRLARVFVAAGVDKVRLTGGEPTLRADLADIVRGLREAGVRAVGMTTNGLVLTRRLPALQRAGLSALNVSLDSLRADRYERMARRPGLARVLAGVDLALQLGYSPVKINVVLMKGFNDDEISDFVEYTIDRDVEVRFIEFMPFSGNRWDDSKLVPYRAALAAARARHQLQPGAARPHDTATLWRAAGARGSVGFISSMTQHFCSSCNRLRLTADGNLKVCLFGAAEVSLRDAARAGASDAALTSLVRAALRNKKARHAGTYSLHYSASFANITDRILNI
uniref:SFRICE_024918 n=1 Tax=Spodoptera frugiperda TaxID=7108 RepID=A0A2H1VKZ1_SPOFR